ncbi:hypothetical protein IFM89_022796 [Coptis chinensis]|uniref:Uncharacterized protein n=1 Tax=Coptis chinensis TaxID=261450 RepID=A0A835I3C0_9MAGN|nr:hypothetical protein IFM89_022796 [Coptis chinensis]
MTCTVEKPSLSSQRRSEPELNLREWTLKASISRDTTKSRRRSASNFRTYGEDTKSFRSNTNISSTASSPGYISRDEIDPSTYSFTTALKALQARSGYGWEWLSPEGVALNSKWNEAEKYICNPLSGEFPMECLSAKTPSGRSFATLKAKITMSGPLVYSSRKPLVQTKPTVKQEHHHEVHSAFGEKKVYNLTRDVGTQSTPPDVGSSSPSPASSPIRGKCGSPEAFSNSKYEIETDMTKEVVELKKEEQTNDKVINKCKQGKCLPWRSLWMRKKHRENLKSLWKILFRKRNLNIKKCIG